MWLKVIEFFLPIQVCFTSCCNFFQITRTRSVPDLTSYIRASSKYKPQWPYRYYRDWDLVGTVVDSNAKNISI